MILVIKAEQPPVPFLGPRQGKWADPQHTIPWKDRTYNVTVHSKITGGEPWNDQYRVADEKEGHVQLSRHKTVAAGPWMPKSSVKHFINDLAGKVELEHTGHPEIDAVVSGKAEFLGKGDDGLAFRVGDRVVKVSTTVPYQPENPNHKTPEEAVQRLRSQVEVSNKLADITPGVQRSEFHQFGDKGFQIKPWVEIPKKLTSPQLHKVTKILNAIHAAGYVLRDRIQVGLDKNNEPVMYDVGKAALQRKPGSRNNDEVEADQDELQRLYKEHGATRVQSVEDNDPHNFVWSGNLEPHIERLKTEAPASVDVTENVTRMAQAGVNPKYLKYLGAGAEGAAYLDGRTGSVHKVFHRFKSPEQRYRLQGIAEAHEALTNSDVSDLVAPLQKIDLRHGILTSGHVKGDAAHWGHSEGTWEAYQQIQKELKAQEFFGLEYKEANFIHTETSLLPVLVDIGFVYPSGKRLERHVGQLVDSLKPEHAKDSGLKLTLSTDIYSAYKDGAPKDKVERWIHLAERVYGKGSMDHTRNMMGMHERSKAEKSLVTHTLILQKSAIPTLKNLQQTVDDDHGKVKRIGAGNFGAKQIVFSNGLKATLKVQLFSDQLFRGIPRNTQYLREVAASMLDQKILHFGIVPPAIKSTFKGTPASIQVWVDGVAASDLVPHVFNKSMPGWEDRVARLATKVNTADLRKIILFDLIVNNTDRHAKNIVFDTMNQRAWAIDHGLAFGQTYYRYNNVFHRRMYRYDLFLMPSEIELLESISLGELQLVLGPYLKPHEVEETYWRIQWILEQENLGFLKISQGADDKNTFPAYSGWFKRHMRKCENRVVAAISAMGTVAPS